MSLIDESRRGDRAADVLSNEVYIEAFAMVEAALYAKWRDADAKDAEGIRQMGRLLRKVQQVMEGVMNSGRIADKALEMERSKLDRMKDVFKRTA